MEGEFKNVSSQNLECPVCLNIFSEPKLLSCAHTFCKACLERLTEFHDDDQTLLCPICREPTQVQDVSKLQTNLALRALVEDVKNQYQSCTHCKSKEKPQAVFYCQECGKYLCTTCQTTHSKWEEDHKVLAVSEIASGKISVRIYRKCRKHRKEDEEFFCSDCRIFVCFRCGIMEHKDEGHQIIEASVYERNHTESLQELKSNAQKKQSSIQKYIDFIVEQKKCVSNVRNQCVDDINKAYEESVEQLTEKKNHLVGEVKTKTSEVDAELDKMKESAKQQIDHVTTITDLLANGTKIPLEIDALAAHDTLCQELQETFKQDDPDYKQVRILSKKGKRVTFEKNVGTDELGLGEIVDSVGKDIALPTTDIISSMAPTPDGRMAVGCCNGRIQIFSADCEMQQTVLENVTIRVLEFLSDGRYVVLDYNNNITLYTTKREKLSVEFETLSDEEGGYGNLTVDKDDQIYVSYIIAEKIQVFSSTGGKAIREIPRDEYVPVQIISYNDSLIIDYGIFVRIIDQEGKVKRHVKILYFSPGPLCLTQDNSILISRLNRNDGLVSIGEYTTELKHVKTLISDYKIKLSGRGNLCHLREFKSGEIAFCTADRLYIFN